ncbi:hypothetical protein JKF63_03853 [Porcisia hertigi]|uniref:Uncharacterized protein n=1 Tax=Porcisia hertigi TaxID=2761500 RepID=A0A836LF12_9TRYP|nr:hypothetical protein JKF63_03853 [Porcisia hertigi]
MEAETLLWLTALNLGDTALQSASPIPQENTPATPMPLIAISANIRSSFIKLWTEQFYHTISDKDSLRSTLLFFLPGHWCSDPCDTHNLELSEDVSVGTSSLAPPLEQCHTRRVKKQWAETPLLRHLETLVVYLQPKPPHLQLWWEEWLNGLDRVLTALQRHIIQLHSGCFRTFCDIHNTFSKGDIKLSWQDVRHSYALTVCNFCRTIESKLVTVVAHTIAASINACKENVRLQLFRTSKATNADKVAIALTSLLQVKLGTVASSAALNTSFVKLYPETAASFAAAEESRDESLAILQKSTSAYVENLLAFNAERGREESGLREPSTFLPTQSATADQPSTASSTLVIGQDKKTVLQSAGDSPYTLRPVSAEDALALTAVVKEKVYFSGATHTVPVENVEGGSYSVLAQPKADERTKLDAISSVSRNQENRFSCGESPEPIPPDVKGERVQFSSNDTKSVLIFWKRLQKKLDLDEASLAHAMALCTFQDGSPYPNVFLRDLDVCNNDRASRDFLEEVRPLFASEGSSMTEMKNAHLVCKACTKYGKELWEKTVLIRETLPFLPARVCDILLGRMYTALRADKQFESLRQIHAQACQTAPTEGDIQKNRATLIRTQVLLLKRVEVLSHSFSCSDYATVEEKCSSALSSVATSASQPERQVKTRLQKIVEDTIRSNQGSQTSTRRSSPLSRGLRFLKLFRTSSVKSALCQSSVAEVLTQSQEGVADVLPADLPPSTLLVDVYTEACRRHGVKPNSILLQKFRCSNVTSFATLDLPRSSAGLKGLRPVLDLLCYNAENLVSLSVCNNNLESDDINSLCSVLRGPAGTNLVYLDLSHNPFTNTAFASLKELLLSLPSLTTLVTKGTLLSPDATCRLQDILKGKMMGERSPKL